MEKQQTLRLAEMLNWLAENPKYTRRLCIDGYETKGAELLQLIEVLEEKEYYEFLAILLIKNQMELDLDYALTKLKTKLIAREITAEKTKELCAELKHLLMEKQLQNIRTEISLCSQPSPR